MRARTVAGDVHVRHCPVVHRRAHRHTGFDHRRSVPRLPIPHQGLPAAGASGPSVVGYIAPLDPVRPPHAPSTALNGLVTLVRHVVAGDPFFSPD
jgi:hypothetical protein